MRDGAGAIAVDERVLAVPATPYRGIQPFRYVDHPIFFAREEDGRFLSRLVAMYRGVFLYGDSGNGKSSLINAALLPEATALGFHPERVRVQPRRGEELVIERIPTRDDDSEWLPSHLASADEHSARVVLPTEHFEARVRAASRSDHRPLLIFDQFEEILTLFEEPGADELQRRIVGMLVKLLREPLAVKLVFSFREDYLGKVTQLLAAVPELVDQAVRLGPPSPDALWTIIRGPFERYPGHFTPELTPQVAEPLCAALAERFGAGDLSLSEVQTVCLRLWEAEDPETLLAERGVQGLLEDYLGEALDAFSPELRRAAIALLGHMVTSAGTRNVISAEDLVQRVRAEEDIDPRTLEQALNGLERQSRLVRRERRRDLYLYEITSEFLVPWITRRRAELNEARERRRLIIRFGSIAAGLLVLMAVVAVLAIWAVRARNEAQDQSAKARTNSAEAQQQSNRAAALALSSRTATLLQNRPDVSLLLALAAFRASPETVEARSSLLAALPAAQRGIGLLAILHGQLGGVTEVAFSPDGRRLASASKDGTIALWDVATRRLVGRPLTGHKGSVNSIAFSHDGKILASGGDDRTIRLWDIATGRQLGRMAKVGGRVYSLAFSPSGKLFASASEDGTVRLWDVGTREAFGVLRPHSFSRQIAFSPDGRTLVTTGSSTKLWDVRTLRSTGLLWSVRATKPGHPVEFGLSVSFSRDGKTLAFGTTGGTTFWKRSSLKRAARVGGHSGFVSSVAFGRGQTVASAEGRTIRLSNARTGRQLGPRLTGHTDAVSSVAFSPDAKILASASSDGTIRLWNARARTPREPRLLGSSGESDVAFSRDGRTLASAGADGSVQLWDTRTRKPLGKPLTGHHGPVNSVAFSPDGKVLASGGADATARLWKVRTHKSLARLKHGDYVNSVAFSPDGKILASASDDSTVRLWDTQRHKEVGRRADPDRFAFFTSVALSPPDAKVIAAAADDGTVWLWDRSSRKRLATLEDGSGEIVNSVAFNPAGTILASAGDDGTITLWDVKTRDRLGFPLTSHGNRVNAVAFSPDGHTLASANSDKSIVLWDLDSRTRFGPPLTGHTEAVNAVAFSRDGTTLASASNDKTIGLVNVTPWRDFDGLTKTICSLLGGDLSRPEWENYVADIPYRHSCSR